MEKQMPLVSVIIPTYKRPDTLDRAIKSVLNQTYQNIEVVVVDDNNPDSEGRFLTIEKMNEFATNSKVIYIKHEKNKNGSAARNTGARVSQGKYLAFLDDDDEFLPPKIAMQVEKMESLSNDWAACYTCSYDEFNGERKLSKTESREGNLFIEALKRNFKSGAGSNLLVRKTVFDELGGFDESFIRNQDYEIVVKIFTKYKIAYIDQPGLVIHAHVGSKSVDYDKVTEQFINSFKKYIDRLPLKEQKDVYKTLNEQRYLYKLRQHFDIWGCLKMIVKGEISFIRGIYLPLKGIYGYIKHRM